MVIVRRTGAPQSGNQTPADWRERLAGYLRNLRGAGVRVVGAKRLADDGGLFSMGEFVVHPKGFHHLGRGVGAEAYRFPEEVDTVAGGLLAVDEQTLGAAQGQALPVIFFSILLAIMITTLGDRSAILIEFFGALFEAIMKLVQLVIWMTPVGVFSLLAWTVARIGLASFGQAIGGYMITVTVGLAIHGFIVLPIICRVFGKCNPYKFMHQMRQAMMTALGTDSSSATLPVTMECATENAGISKRSAGFVLPLGSTINMDGTALYEAVAVVFLAQAYGIELGLPQLVLVAITATLAAIGAAGIPSAGLVTMVIVINAVNPGLEAMGKDTIPIAAIGLIIGVDRILDMMRTTVNVWGDAVGAKIVDSIRA